MASNKKLKDDIEELAERLGVPADTTDLNNAEMTALRKSLQEQVDALPPAPEPEKAKEPEPETFDYSVAAGCSVTCRKGVRGPGEEMREAWLWGDGKESLRQLIESGHVVVANEK